ncbi:MAG: hypothetical protein ACREEM_35490 [Blastocatellia bacterium]
MNLHQVSDLQISIGEILKSAGANGVLLESGNLPQYALLPLDDDLLDFLIERNPKLIEECRQILQRMRNGEFHTQDEVERLFAENP